MRNEHRKRDIDILMNDRCTKREAEKLLKNGSIVYENPEEWIINLKACDCYNGETLDDVRAGKIRDVSMVEYEGHEYLIEYVL